MQLQRSFALLVSLSALSSVVNKKLLVTNEGRNLCREGDKLNVKNITCRNFSFFSATLGILIYILAFQDCGVQNN